MLTALVVMAVGMILLYLYLTLLYVQNLHYGALMQAQQEHKLREAQL